MIKMCFDVIEMLYLQFVKWDLVCSSYPVVVKHHPSVESVGEGLLGLPIEYALTSLSHWDTTPISWTERQNILQHGWRLQGNSKDDYLFKLKALGPNSDPYTLPKNQCCMDLDINKIYLPA